LPSQTSEAAQASAARREANTRIETAPGPAERPGDDLAVLHDAGQRSAGRSAAHTGMAPLDGEPAPKRALLG
jgi:hypothetical protein